MMLTKNIPYYARYAGVGLLLSAAAVQADISGKVFHDFNANGTFDTGTSFNEVGMAGVTVKAFDATGAQVGTAATTNADGSYTLTGLTASTDYRVEFSWAQSWLKPGTAGGTSVQFAKDGATGINAALSNPAQYCQANPKVSITRMVPDNETTKPTVLSFDYTSSGDDRSSVTEFAHGSDHLGTTWGTAYRRDTKKLYVSAVLRRHASEGNLGFGGIYEIDTSNPGAAPVEWFTVANVGTLATRNIPANGNPSHDVEAYQKIGKVSLGDIDISDDGKTLYAMNLNSRSLVPVDIASKTAAAPIAVGDPGCSSPDDVRPWAVKVHEGNVYVGVVCSDESVGSITSKFQAHVMKLDGSSFTKVASMPLTYEKNWAGPGRWDNKAACEPLRGWFPWTSNPTNFTSFTGCRADLPNTAIQPQPILSDLEFDVDGSIVLGLLDRFAMQAGNGNYAPDTSNTGVYGAFSGGDIRRICNVAGNYVAEGGAGCAFNGGDQLSKFNEFYVGDEIRYSWDGQVSSIESAHSETALGGLALRAGAGSVLTTVYDPLDDLDAGNDRWGTQGLRWLSNTNGSMLNSFEVVSNLDEDFGKVAGVGDLELLCDEAPIEIGNRVWHDIDSDGIQDADEPGIDSVEVKLFCGSSGTEWVTTTTANGGLFRFTNAAGGNALFMDYGEDCTLWVDNNQIALSTYSLTDQDADNITDNNALTDLRDSDAATNASMAEIKFTVGKAGENNHTLDFGYKPTPNETHSIGNRVWFDTNNNGTADVGESPVGAGVKLELKNAAGAVLQSVTTDANGHYVFAGLAYSASGYKVCLTADNFTAGGLLENYQSSTGFTDPNATAVDGDDSGDDNESDGVCSTAVMLEYNEPTGELGIDGNYDGNDGAGTLDFLSDLTVDFGVVASTPSFPPPPGPSVMSCTADTRLATSIHVNGDSQAAGSTGAGVNGLITFDYAATGELVAPFSKGTAGQVGSVWGLAYDATRKKLYTSAFLKRHASFGPGGVGAIYQMDGTSASATPSLLIDLAANGVDLGSSPRTPSNGVVDDPNELPADASQPSWDRDAFAQIGKISLGDIDISADGNTLWVVNLKQRELVEINLTNTTVTAKHAIPDPGCSNGEFRPWAVKVHDGKVWVGSICSAETSQQAADLKAYVQAFDGTTFTTATSFALNYPKGSVGNGPGDEKWQPWTSTFKTLASGEFAIYPQPILSDIEFDMDGSLILGFMDRMGHQVGGVNYTPNYPDDDTMTQGQTGGDIIRVCNNGGKYELENNATCTSGSTAGKDKGQGPGNGEYYWGEMWDFNPWNADGGFHQETSFGGLAFKAGSGEIALTAMNPLNPNANAGGVIWLDNATGGRSANAGVQVYRQQGAGSPYFGKAAGMGDLEIFCAEAPPVTHSIGNRIWFDSNNNGTADSGEQHAGNGIKLELKDSTGNTVLQTTTTDANGRYLFHGLTAGNYQVCVTADNFAVGSKLEKYRSSTGQADTEGSSTDGTDRGDDDLSNGSCSTVLVLDDKEPTGEYGITDQQDGADGQGTPDTHSNLTVDFGFVPPTDLKLVKTVDKASAKRGDMLTYTLALSNESNTVATGVNVTDNLPAGVEIMGNPVASQGSFDKVTRIWNIGTVTANSTVTLSLSVEVK